MSALSEIIPKNRQRIIDLVSVAGVNVSDWGNFKGGESKAASNPKYCYEWAFVEPKKVVVLTLWHAQILEQDGTLVHNFNMRESAHKVGQIPGKDLWKKRSENVDLAIQEAVREDLPIRVVVNVGSRRGVDQPETAASRVEKRLLDPIPWAVTAYDWNTGIGRLMRGAYPDHFVDQFSIPQDSILQQIERRDVSSQVFVRSYEVRRLVLLRAQGKCEYCTQRGFVMDDGRVFLETHHVIPLSEGGSDTKDNVVAICPNHHREAHHGENRLKIREQLLSRLSECNSE
jgi:5-methylcytosine-specific restriction enzyme A